MEYLIACFIAYVIGYFAGVITSSMVRFTSGRNEEGGDA